MIRPIPAALLLTILALMAAAQQNQQQPSSPRSGPYKVDPTYEKLANETGGRVYQMDPAHPVEVADLLALDLSAHTILAAHGALDGPRTFEAPVNFSSQKLLISVTGAPEIEIRRPDQSRLRADSDGVRLYSFLNGPVYVIEQPPLGSWQVTLNGTGNFSIKISTVASAEPAGAAEATSPTAEAEPVELSRFDFQEAGGRIGHEGLFKIQGNPQAGQSYPVEAEIDGDPSTIQFEFRSPAGDVLQKFRLRRTSADSAGSHEFAGEINVPTQPFIIYATGLDMTGHRFQAVRSQLIRPQTFVLQAPRYASGDSASGAEFVVTLSNSGEASTFDIMITDRRGWLRPPSHFPLYVAAGENKRFTVNLDRPAGARDPGTQVLITATRAGDANAINFAAVSYEISPGTPPQ